MNTRDAIDVKAKLSKPAYCYMVLYRSDGEHVLLFPRGQDTVPLMTDQPCYPPRDEEVAYQLDDGPGVWVVAVVASETKFPSFREWQANHPDCPWKPHNDPRQLAAIVIDDTKSLTTPNPSGGLTESSRSEVKITGRVKLVPLVNWWKTQTGGAVKAMAFPVVQN